MTTRLHRSSALPRQPPPTRRPTSPPRCARAEAEGLVDVAYAVTDSPIGPLLVAATAAGLVRLGLPDARTRTMSSTTSPSGVSPRVLEAPARLDEVRRELDEYFDGRRDHFELPARLAAVPGLPQDGARAALRRRRLRPHGELPRAGDDGRQPEGQPGRRHGDGHQPDPHRRPVPPGPPHRRQPRRLRRRPPRQGQAPRARAAGQTLFDEICVDFRAHAAHKSTQIPVLTPPGQAPGCRCGRRSRSCCQGGAGLPLPGLAEDEVDRGELGVDLSGHRRRRDAACAASTRRPQPPRWHRRRPRRVAGDALGRGDRRTGRAEQLGHRLGLGGVVERRRRAVGVHVRDVGRGRVRPSSRASSMHDSAPRPPGDGAVMWWASAVEAPPSTSARIVAPRASAHLPRLQHEDRRALGDHEAVARRRRTARRRSATTSRSCW